MIKKIKNICCIGAGYVGGPTMAVIADKCPHLNIYVVDVNEKRISDWNNADSSCIPIYEPGLSKLIDKCRNRNLYFSTNVEKYISLADMIFISVNTPTKKKGFGAGKASDLKWVDASARQIAKYAKGETIVVEKSTLPVKTANTIKNILEASLENDTENKVFYVLSNPEFLSEGTAINDLINPDRVLIGGEDQTAIDELKDIYLNWVENNKILTTDLWSSELSKLTANAFLAQRISSINSISALCEATDADIKDVSLAIRTDKRIGNYFLNPGPGFGGSCFKKDILNLVYICNHYGLNEVSSYWEQVIKINAWQQKRISKIIVDKLFGTISNKKISILGFAFKSNTNDTRESPAISICKDLLAESAHLKIYDPRVSENMIMKELNYSQSYSSNENLNYGVVQCCQSVKDSVEGSDAIVIMTEWDEFKNLDWHLISKNIRRPCWLFDTRLVADAKKAKKYGIRVWQVGCGY